MNKSFIIINTHYDTEFYYAAVRLLQHSLIILMCFCCFVCSIAGVPSSGDDDSEDYLDEFRNHKTNKDSDTSDKESVNCLLCEILWLKVLIRNKNEHIKYLVTYFKFISRTLVQNVPTEQRKNPTKNRGNERVTSLDAITAIDGNASNESLPFFKSPNALPLIVPKPSGNFVKLRCVAGGTFQNILWNEKKIYIEYGKLISFYRKTRAKYYMDKGWW